MSFPRELSTYADPANAGMWEVIKARAAAEPFNVVVTAIFEGRTAAEGILDYLGV